MAIKCPKCQFENPDDTIYCGKCESLLKPLEGVSVTKTFETTAKGLTSGTTFATRYEVVEEVGVGGMGRVYKALDKEINEEVAIKLLNPEIASDETTIERFRNELKFARKIAHKNVCRMYHLGKEQDTPYITMEYVGGEDLKRLVKRKGKLEEEKVLSIAEQVCEGLIEAHRLGVVHRDLKPQNVMINEQGDVKIMDFGIARSLEAPGITQTGVMIGTPDYISPEQAEGEDADHRSDIYALGVILYEMVTGRVPFKGDTALEVALKHKSKVPAEPKELNTEISKDLNTLIMICMQKDRQVRYQNAEELLEDIKNIEAGIPLGERILPKKKREINWKRIFLYGGAPLLLVLVIAAASLLFMGRGPAIDSIAVLPFENLTGDTEQEYFVEGITDELIWQMGRIGELRIISRPSVMRYKETEKPLPEIARELNVDALVEGEVQKVGDSVSIRVRLIDALPEERNLWEKTYDREMTDVFLLYSEVAREISREVRAKLTPQEETHFASTRQVDPEAYEAYLKGESHRGMGTPEGFNKSLAFYNQAIEKDPTFAMAYAGLALAYNSIGHSAMAKPDSFPRALAAARSALRLDETLIEAHAAIALVKTYHEWDWEGAEKAYKRVLELNPSLAFAHYHYSWYLVLFGRMEEAIKEHRLAKELDPLNPPYTAWLGDLYRREGRYEEAIEECRRALELDPDHPVGWGVLCGVYADKGMFEEAIEIQQKFVAEDPSAKSGLGVLYARAGRRDEALKILAELLKEEPTPSNPGGLAALYTALGEYDEAFRWAEVQFENPGFAFPWIRVSRATEPVRDDPRFKDLMRRMNLPEAEKSP